MEITTEVQKISYSLKEKFLLIGPEQRINRSRFFTRSIVIGLLATLLGIIISFLGGLLLGFTGLDQTVIITIVTVISLLLQNGIMFYVYPNLITKRCHDFNESGKKYSMIYRTLVVLLTIVGIIPLFINLSEFSFTEIITGLQILGVIFQLYLFLKPGMLGDNQYGPDDSNVKTGFLG